MTRQEMKALAKQQISGKIGILFLISLIIMLISSALSFIPVIGSIASLFISAAFALSTHTIYLNIAKNPEKNPDVNDTFIGFQNILGAIKVYFANFIFTFLWSLLFLIPGIIKSFAYSQCFFILAENPEISGREALKRSEEMMKGHKMEYFVLSLSFFGWMLLGGFTCGLLYIWLLPYMNATLANFYNSIKPAAVTENIDNVQFN